MKIIRVILLISAFLISFLPVYSQGSQSSDDALARKEMESPEYLLNMAFFYYNNMEYDKAIEMFERHIEVAGETEVTLMQLGKIYDDLKQGQKAKGYFERALKLNPSNKDALGYMADIALTDNDVDSAIDYLVKITELDPIDERALFTLAQIYEQKKEARKSMVYYKKLSLATLKNSANVRLLVRAYTKIARYYSDLQDYANAMIYYKKVVELNPQDPTSQFIYAELLKLNGKFRESADVLLTLLELNPGNESVLESLVETLYILNDYRTRAYLNSYFENANRPKLLFSVIKSQLDGKNDKARELFYKISQRAPNRLSIHIGIYNSLDQSKPDELEEAKREAYTVAILAQKIKSYSLAMKYMENVFHILSIQEGKDSIENFKKYPKVDNISDPQEKIIQEYIDAYFTHATTLDNTGQFKQSMALYLTSLDYNEKLIDYYRSKYNFKEQVHSESDLYKNKEVTFSDDEKKVHNDLKNLLDKKYETLLNLSWIILKNLDKSNYDIEKYIKESMETRPDDQRAYYINGLYLQEKARKKREDVNIYKEANKNFGKAVEILEEKTENHKAAPNYYFYYGITAEKSGNFKEMEKNLKQAIELDPNNPMYLNYLGYMYSQKNENLDQAFQYIKGALEDDPENAAYLDTLGWIYYKMSKYDEALGQLLVAKSISEKDGKSDPVISFHIAETYQKLGNKNQALFFYEAALNDIKQASEELDVNYIKKQINELKQ